MPAVLIGAGMCGFSCRLASARMQVYVAIHDGHRTKALRIHLQKGTRNRLQEDDVASRLVLSPDPSNLLQLPDGLAWTCSLVPISAGVPPAFSHRSLPALLRCRSPRHRQMNGSSDATDCCVTGKLASQVLRSLAEGCGLEEAARSLSLGLRQETGAVVNGFAPRESMDGAAPQYERLQVESP